MKLHRTIPAGALCLLFSLTIGSATLLTGQTVLLQESFETDGAGTRYTVQNPSDDGSNDYFARRQERSVGTLVVGGDLDGDWFWAAQDIDADGAATEDLPADHGRVIFNSFNIAGYSNLVVSLAAGSCCNELEFDNFLMVQYQVDGGEWITVGGFRGTYTNSPGRFFVGDARTFPSNDNPRTTRTFTNYSWDINASGSTMAVRIHIAANGSNEGYCFDNVVVTGIAGLPSLGAAMSAATVTESAGSVNMNFSLTQPAPAGGLMVSLSSSDYDRSELNLPASVTIPAGTSNYSLPVPVINDGRFDSDELIYITVSAPGYARQLLQLTTLNEHAKPNIVMTEVYPTPTRGDLTTDTNGDGSADTENDEYVEIVNLGDVPYDISGWKVNDNLGPRHFVPQGTVLQPMQAYVIFGGGNPTGLFGGAVVHTASTGNIAPSGEGDTMTLIAGEATVSAISFEGAIGSLDYSVVLQNETSGAVISLFDISGASGPKFTPGRKNDNSTWATFTNTAVLEGLGATLAENAAPMTGTLKLQNAGSAQLWIEVRGDDTGEVTVSPASPITVTEAGVQITVTPNNDGILDGDREVDLYVLGAGVYPAAHRITVQDVQTDPYNVVVNEAFSSIFGTGGDANNNGLIEEPLEDQFIEIVNNGTEWVNLSGWMVEAYADVNLTGSELIHIFPTGTWLAPSGAILLFGGGDIEAMNAAPANVFGGAQIQLANVGGNGVNLPDYEGFYINLITPDGYFEDAIFADSAITNQSMSIVRSPDGSGAFGALHFDNSSAFELFSPGRTLAGTAFAGNSLELPNWAGYPYADEMKNVDTGDFLGWINVWYGNYIWSYHLANWMYLPESSVTQSGAWAYVFRF